MTVGHDNDSGGPDISGMVVDLCPVQSVSVIHDGPLGLCRNREVPPLSRRAWSTALMLRGETSYSTMQSLGSERFLPQSFTVLV